MRGKYIHIYICSHVEPKKFVTIKGSNYQMALKVSLSLENFNFQCTLIKESEKNVECGITAAISSFESSAMELSLPFLLNLFPRLASILFQTSSIMESSCIRLHQIRIWTFSSRISQCSPLKPSDPWLGDLLFPPLLPNGKVEFRWFKELLEELASNLSVFLSVFSVPRWKYVRNPWFCLSRSNVHLNSMNFLVLYQFGIW